MVRARVTLRVKFMVLVGVRVRVKELAIISCNGEATQQQRLE